jgi:hypothetical protein
MDLLTYTPPQDRDLRGEIVQDRHVDCREHVDYDMPQIWDCTRDCFDADEIPHPLNGRPLIPVISACTAGLKHYRAGTHEERTSLLTFWNRESFEAAYRVARAIQNHRMVHEVTVFGLLELSPYHRWIIHERRAA